MTRKKTSATVPVKSPMPTMCKICQSGQRPNTVSDDPIHNPCFDAERMSQYQPFAKDERTIPVTCGNFTHIRSMSVVMRTKGKRSKLSVKVSGLTAGIVVKK